MPISYMLITNEWRQRSGRRRRGRADPDGKAATTDVDVLVAQELCGGGGTLRHQACHRAYSTLASAQSRLLHARRHRSTTSTSRTPNYRCYLHRQITRFIRSCDFSFDVVSRIIEHIRVYPSSAPSIEVVVLRPAA
jgi:hypothetical protein